MLCCDGNGGRPVPLLLCCVVMVMVVGLFRCRLNLLKITICRMFCGSVT